MEFEGGYGFTVPVELVDVWIIGTGTRQPVAVGFDGVGALMEVNVVCFHRTNLVDFHGATGGIRTLYHPLTRRERILMCFCGLSSPGDIDVDVHARPEILVGDFACDPPDSDGSDELSEQLHMNGTNSIPSGNLSSKSSITPLFHCTLIVRTFIPRMLRDPERE